MNEILLTFIIIFFIIIPVLSVIILILCFIFGKGDIGDNTSVSIRNVEKKYLTKVRDWGIIYSQLVIVDVK